MCACVSVRVAYARAVSLPPFLNKNKARSSELAPAGRARPARPPGPCTAQVMVHISSCGEQSIAARAKASKNAGLAGRIIRQQKSKIATYAGARQDRPGFPSIFQEGSARNAALTAHRCIGPIVGIEVRDGSFPLGRLDVDGAHKPFQLGGTERTEVAFGAQLAEVHCGRVVV